MPQFFLKEIVSAGDADLVPAGEIIRFELIRSLEDLVNLAGFYDAFFHRKMGEDGIAVGRFYQHGARGDQAGQVVHFTVAVPVIGNHSRERAVSHLGDQQVDRHEQCRPGAQEDFLADVVAFVDFLDQLRVERGLWREQILEANLLNQRLAH